MRLKAHRIVGMNEECARIENDFYLKSEVDRVIEELKEKHNTEVKELLCLIRDKENNFNRAFDSEEKEIVELKEERRWRKFPDEKPSEEMEGEDFFVSNGYYSVVCEWRGYWNNEPFCGDKNCDVVKYWMPSPSAPKEAK